MKLVVPTELYENESRVSITPDIIPSLIKMGFKVFVQSNAGLGSSYTDEDYKKSVYSHYLLQKRDFFFCKIHKKFFYFLDLKQCLLI